MDNLFYLEKMKNSIIFIEQMLENIKISSTPSINKEILGREIDFLKNHFEKIDYKSDFEKINYKSDFEEFINQHFEKTDNKNNTIKKSELMSYIIENYEETLTRQKIKKMLIDINIKDVKSNGIDIYRYLRYKDNTDYSEPFEID